ncbi:DUF6622 family protein [Hydrogenophaga sp.]|uniref:DUF6622 family protein n=1 Tax=Hydrogenophaga sp. TaxID=1904254 RepID=UPI0027212A99|nr:DUF6622 family protein [Hydrogenophaga sp.]MDO9433875.1 hypothetical protein [Hydrogenophaga sp.]
MLSKIPFWVFGVLLLLVFFGYRQSRDRLVTPLYMGAIALAMLGLSLFGVVTAFGPNVAPLLAWAMGVTAVVGLGRSVLRPRGMQAAPGAILVPGSWVPAVLMLGIFVAKFFLGFATGMGLPIVQQPGFVLAASLVFGAFSGAFAVRALVIYGFARESRLAR